MSRAKKPTGLEAKIDAWFQNHFNHLTPGQPQFEYMQKAVADLKRLLGQPDSPQEE